MIMRHLKRLAEYVCGSWFIRVIYGQNEKWEDATAEMDELAGPAFTRSDDKVSVFQVHSDLEEANAIAACQLQRGNTPSKPVIAIRFTKSEFKKAGLLSTKSLGNTGVTSVDKMHHDLHGNIEKYEKLSEIVLYKQRMGYDRVRRMHKNRFLNQFRSFIDNGDSARRLTESARRNCEKHIRELEARL